MADSDDNNTVVKDIVRSYFAPFGRQGGKSKSPRKLAAVKANLAKAHAKRAKAKVVAG